MILVLIPSNARAISGRAKRQRHQAYGAGLPPLEVGGAVKEFRIADCGLRI